MAQQTTLLPWGFMGRVYGSFAGKFQPLPPSPIDVFIDLEVSQKIECSLEITQTLTMTAEL